LPSNVLSVKTRGLVLLVCDTVQIYSYAFIIYFPENTLFRWFCCLLYT